MTDFTKFFLAFVFVYYLVKGALFMAYWIALIIVEKHARMKKEKLRVFLSKKRKKEEDRWQVAYRKLEKKKTNTYTPIIKINKMDYDEESLYVGNVAG